MAHRPLDFQVNRFNRLNHGTEPPGYEAALLSALMPTAEELDEKLRHDSAHLIRGQRTRRELINGQPTWVTRYANAIAGVIKCGT